MSVFRKDMLQGRVALITGGATGIGQQITRLLAEHGASVFICSRKHQSLQAAQQQFAGEGIDCGIAVCDIREPAQVEAMLDDVADTAEDAYKSLGRNGRLDEDIVEDRIRSKVRKLIKSHTGKRPVVNVIAHKVK